MISRFIVEIYRNGSIFSFFSLLPSKFVSLVILLGGGV